MTKPQGQPNTITINILTPTMYTSSTPMAVGLQKTGKRILGHLYKKEARGPLITDQISTAKEGACQAEATVAAEAHTHTSLHTACTTVAKLTISQKTAPYSSNPKKDGARIQAVFATIIVLRSESPMQWASPHNQYSPTYPSLYPPQTYPNNQGQALAYYLSYHYATTNHLQPSLTPQIIYPPPVLQITYLIPNSAN
jgi:hypothetical protein